MDIVLKPFRPSIEKIKSSIFHEYADYIILDGTNEEQVKFIRVYQKLYDINILKYSIEKIKSLLQSSRNLSRQESNMYKLSNCINFIKILIFKKYVDPDIESLKIIYNISSNIELFDKQSIIFNDLINFNETEFSFLHVSVNELYNFLNVLIIYYFKQIKITNFIHSSTNINTTDINNLLYLLKKISNWLLFNIFTLHNHKFIINSIDKIINTCYVSIQYQNYILVNCLFDVLNNISILKISSIYNNDTRIKDLLKTNINNLHVSIPNINLLLSEISKPYSFYNLDEKKLSFRNINYFSNIVEIFENIQSINITTKINNSIYKNFSDYTIISNNDLLLFIKQIKYSFSFDSVSRIKKSEINSIRKTKSDDYDTSLFSKKLEHHSSTSNHTPVDIMNWSNDDIYNWLSNIGLDCYINKFKNNNINIKLLLNINKSFIINNLSITNAEHVEQLLTCVHFLKKSIV